MIAEIIGLFVAIAALIGVIAHQQLNIHLLIRALLAKTLADIDPKTLARFGLIKSEYNPKE